jgi:hypothetical protein
MSGDPREDILLRLEEIAKTIVPESNVWRNTADVPEGQLPAIVILEGDENARESSYGRNRPTTAPIIMDMEPEIHFLDMKPAAEIGPSLNAKRAVILNAIFTDQTLSALCHNGDIRYLGMATGFGAGRSMIGELGLAFSFAYVLRPLSVTDE